MKLKYALSSILCRVSYNITFGFSKDLREIVCAYENNMLKFNIVSIHHKDGYDQIQEKLLRQLFNE